MKKAHQLANFADFCNECGNCDVFCPEDGGPYIEKPRFFGSLEAWRRLTTRDGFFACARTARPDLGAHPRRASTSWRWTAASDRGVFTDGVITVELGHRERRPLRRRRARARPTATPSTSRPT